MKQFSLPPQARVRRKRDFLRAYKQGHRYRIGPLRFCVVEREQHSRLGLSVGRKVGGAVTRNRWKRAIREAFRLSHHLLRRPRDIIVSVAWEAGPEEVRDVSPAFRELVNRLNSEGDR